MALTSIDVKDIEDLSTAIGSYNNGDLPLEAFRPIRLRMGIYGERNHPGFSMVRVKIPGGLLTAQQAMVLADAAENFSPKDIHFTTRQDAQLYSISLEKTPGFLRNLLEGGLSTREAAGSVVRNVTACPYAGICPKENCDVLPYTDLVSRYFLRHPETQDLPRKVKIAFSGCETDCAATQIHDIGIVAVKDHDESGVAFRLYVGGGLGAAPMTGTLLESSTPIEQLLPTCLAVLRVFSAHGERKNRALARLKFLVKKMGGEVFCEKVLAERDQILEEKTVFPEPDLGSKRSYPQRFIQDEVERLEDFERWKEVSAVPQKQPGLYRVTIFLPEGDILPTALHALAKLSALFGNGTLRATRNQNLVVPYIPDRSLGAFFRALHERGLAFPAPDVSSDVTACPGAGTCNTGITASKELGKALSQIIVRQFPELNGKLNIKVSGCPNSCGQHHIAGIGLYGRAKKIGDKWAPFYQILLGGGVDETGTRFGKPLASVPAGHAVQAVLRLLGAFVLADDRKEKSFEHFIAQKGFSALRILLKDLEIPHDLNANPKYFLDIGKKEEFSLLGRGAAECA